LNARRVVVLGEVENEDTVPAYLNVNATPVEADGASLDEQGSFDAISHDYFQADLSISR